MKECDAALAADPHNVRFRSCGSTFQFAGQYERAVEYLRLDAGTNWQKEREAEVRLLQGRREEAARLFEATGDNEDAAFGRYLLKTDSPAERDAVAAKLAADAAADPDPEGKFHAAAFLCGPGYTKAGLTVLGDAVSHGFLAYEAMDRNPLFDSVRKEPEFIAIREEAIRKQKDFVARRDAPPGA